MDVSHILKAYVAQGEDTKDKLLGAALIVVDGNGIAFRGSAGRVDLPLSSAKYDVETFTWVASLTKLITTIAVLQLVDKGLITLDEDLRARVPELATLQVLKGFDDEKPILEDNRKPITLRSLLTHTSGLSYDFVGSNIQTWARVTGRTASSWDCTIEGITAPLVFQPRESWMYSTGIDWAGHVLEIVTGMPLSKYLETNLFEPLGMKHSTFQPEIVARSAKSEASTLHRAGDGTLIHGSRPLSTQGREIDSGGGGLFTTAADYAKVIQAIVKKQVPGFGDETLELLFVPQLDEKQKAACMRIADIAYERMCPEYPRGAPINHTLAGMINEENLPGKRKSGSVMWSGMANGHWWVDAKSGVGGVLLTTLMPLGDPAVIGLFDEVERAVYANRD